MVDLKQSVILASQSKYRAQQLREFGIAFEQCAPQVDEEVLKNKFSDLAPAELCARLALEKCASVARLHPEKVVIGSDQLLHFKNQILGKPGDAANNVEQLKLLTGASHNLITAVSVMHAGRTASQMIVAKIKMRELSEAAIRQYVISDRAYDCAGGYKIESSGIALMESIETDDFTSIRGLPLIALTNCFINLGVLKFGGSA